MIPPGRPGPGRLLFQQPVSRGRFDELDCAHTNYISDVTGMGSAGFVSDLGLVMAIRRHAEGLEVPWHAMADWMQPVSLERCSAPLVSAALREWARQLAAGSSQVDIYRLIEVGWIGALFADILVHRGESSPAFRAAYGRAGGDLALFDNSHAATQGRRLAEINRAEPSIRLDLVLELPPSDPYIEDVWSTAIAADVLDLDPEEISRRFASEVLQRGSWTRRAKQLSMLYVGFVAIPRGIVVPGDVLRDLPPEARSVLRNAVNLQANKRSLYRLDNYIPHHWGVSVLRAGQDAWSAHQSPRRRVHLTCKEVPVWRWWLDL
jgi:hypothetical protein